MEIDKNMKDAVSSFVELLEVEQREDKLIENSLKKRSVAPAADMPGMETIAKIVKKIISLVCIGEGVSINTDVENLKFSIQGEDLSMAIGRDGKNMAALEYIVNLIGLRKKLIEHRVTIDIKDYRKNKISKIKKTALEMAEKVIREGKKIALKPMCSYERKAIHNALSKLKKVTTRSRYEEPNRRIVIYPARDLK